MISKQKKDGYSPSAVGLVFKQIHPIASSCLPKSFYQWLYTNTYDLYRKAKRLFYFLYNLRYICASNGIKGAKARATYKLLPYTMGGSRALENAFDVTMTIENNNVPGDIVECGVARGGSAAMMALTSLSVGRERRRLWLFDSFQGLPEPTREDFINGKAGNFIRPLPKGSCLGTIQEVKSLLEVCDIEARMPVKYIKGWFQDTIPSESNKIKSIAILRLDGDWYESTKIPLMYLYSKLSDNGALIIDDYYTCFGSKRAVDEFMDELNLSPNFYSDNRGGVYFFKNRNMDLTC